MCVFFAWTTGSEEVQSFSLSSGVCFPLFSGSSGFLEKDKLFESVPGCLAESADAGATQKVDVSTSTTESLKKKLMRSDSC